MSTKKGFIKRVMEFLDGGEEAKIKRFQKKAIKFMEKQISIRENEIEEIGERIEDKKEEYQNSQINVNLDLIKTVEDTKQYAEKYVSNLIKLQGEIDDLTEQANTKADEIDVFKSIIEDIK